MDTKQVNVQKDIPNLRKIPCLRYVPPPRLGLYITAMDAKKPTGTWQQAQILNGNLAKLPVKTTTHIDNMGRFRQVDLQETTRKCISGGRCEGNHPYAGGFVAFEAQCLSNRRVKFQYPLPHNIKTNEVTAMELLQDVKIQELLIPDDHVKTRLSKVQRLTQDFLLRTSVPQEIQKSRGQSIVQILARKLSVQGQGHGDATLHVIQRALDLLVTIHRAYVESNLDVGIENSNGNGCREDPVLEDTRRRRAIHGLLDLISLEGIYPALSQGVGIPLQQRVMSTLPTGVVARQPEATSKDRLHDERLLRLIIDALTPIVCHKHSGIQPIVMGRILGDILCATAELAFHPHSLPQEQTSAYAELFQKLIQESPTPTLLSILSSFIQTSSAPWFKNIISSELSHVPLRKDGVFHTIIFIASQFEPALGQSAETAPAQGPPITVQAIMQISRLLSSVPQGISADDYFYNTSPKLLALLDGDEPDLQKTASYVIGSGILGKRALGEPGAIGYKIFVKPILDSLHGNMTTEVAAWLRRFSLDGSALPESPLSDLEGVVLINEPKLLLSLTRLSALVLLHPNPSLLKRLIQPVLLPLWALGCYAKEHQKSSWYGKVSTLLQTFFSMSTGVSKYDNLSDNILWDGGKTWTFGPGQNGGVSIRKRTNSPAQQVLNTMLLMKILDDRIDGVLELLGLDPQSEELAGDIFLHVSRKWLLGHSENHTQKEPEFLHGGEDLQTTLQKLTSAKFTEKLLNKFKDSLARHPDRILGIVEQLIQSEVSLRTKTAHGKLNNPSFQSLGNIVENSQGISDNDNPEQSESLSASFSLLSTILASPDFFLSETLSPVIQRIKVQLDNLLPNLPSHLMQPANTASMLLEMTLSSSLSPERKPEAISSRISDLEKHRQALEHLSSPLPPIQAEGLTILSCLITESSPVLDIPATLSLLLSLLSNSNIESSSNDEFVYLHVIKIIGILASRHPRTVIGSLAERYADRSEQHSLEQRLKIGEALLRAVQELGNALVEDTARTLGGTMVSVAGRRGRKPSAKRARGEMAKKLTTQPTETEDDTLDREAADLMQQIDEAMDSEVENPALEAYSANIIDAWAAGAASDLEPDDLRVRASAMSILASAIQTNVAGLGPSVVSSSVDLALSTLNFEQGPESVILRRAAIILILDLVKALDTARENGINLGFGFSYSTTTNNDNQSTDFINPQLRYPNQGIIGNIPDILRVLTFVETSETDPIVRGHIRVLIESFEAWLEKSLLWGVRTREGMGEQPSFELGDRLAGLDIHPRVDGGGGSGRQGSGQGPRIEEIE
ncbi:predicted protein [Histoplasma mississippiense (nom. inval.)]|uniref:predicted protein n=1 Tax=Ajellomyces capsulatus (strain NAm1 / WU24) TaxID=2059318 RepID=UPI000157B65F|nr:predicted protein [Histoplasma mississippiense (nom. inval.)]EDN02459.1 predicted protein [Histoplasma mississippiense (nom. inval.)]